MSKCHSSVSTLLRQWIALYNKTDHIIFTTDGAIVYCQLCDKKIVYTKKCQIQQHVDTTLHVGAVKRKANKKKTIIFIRCEV